MEVAIVFNPMRRTYSFLYQYLLLKKGLESYGFRVTLFDTFHDRVSDYDVLIWWAPFRTEEFEDDRTFKKRYTKLQLFYNPLDTDSTSETVINKVSRFADGVITHSPENALIWGATKKDVILRDFAIDPDDIPEDCGLKGDLYYYEYRTFPIRRGTDIALSYDVKHHTINGYYQSHKDYLREVCKAGNYIIPARGGEYELLTLEALAMGMKVYYSDLPMFRYVKDIPPTFPVHGKYCLTEFSDKVYQTGCYHNVIRVEELPDLPSPDSKHYIKDFTAEETVKPIVRWVEKW